MAHEGEWKWLNSGETVRPFVWHEGDNYLKLNQVLRNSSGRPNLGIEGGCMYTYGQGDKAYDYPCDAAFGYPLCQIPY